MHAIMATATSCGSPMHSECDIVQPLLWCTYSPWPAVNLLFAAGEALAVFCCSLHLAGIVHDRQRQPFVRGSIGDPVAFKAGTVIIVYLQDENFVSAEVNSQEL